MVRVYDKSDWREVCRVFDSSKPLELASAGIEASFVPLADDAARIASFARSTILVWHEEETLRGFVGYKGNYISWLFVDPVAFRKGIATALLRAVLPRIEGEAWLWVAKGNAAAIALYSSEGFEKVEERELRNKGLPCLAVKLSRRKNEPNKAPEPTTMAVTPRASSRTSK